MTNAALPRKPILIALIFTALSASLQSCGAGSLLPLADTFTPTATIIPSQTLTPTPTATIPHTEWPLVMAENFNQDNESWPIGELNNEFVRGDVMLVGGKYYVKLTARKTAFWYCFPETDDLLDVFVSVKVDQWGGSKNTEYGLIVRGTEDVAYLYTISSMLMGYEFSKMTEEDVSVLTLWTGSSRILVGEPNRIGIKAQGSEFAFFINGEQVDDAYDEDVEAGRVGLGILFPHSGDWIEITFDDFEVRALPE